MSFALDRPWLLALALLAVPLFLLGLRARPGGDAVRRWTILTLRTLLLALVAFLLAGPRFVQEHDRLTVIGLLDVSGSVERFADLPAMPAKNVRTNLDYLRAWFREAADVRAPDDRFGLIVFDGRALAVSTPTRGRYADEVPAVIEVEGTNIAEAIRLGLAMFPADTARRLVLVSDGNETAGDALAAAREAAGLSGEGARAGALGVPIDVVPVAYRVESDVQVVRLDVPPTAEPNQRVTARIVLESIRDTPGTLTLWREGRPVDLNGPAPGHAREVTATAGRSVFLAPVDLGETPINRFDAVFEPAKPGTDALVENNRAEAFTATPTRGLVLLVDGQPELAGDPLLSTLREAEIRVDRVAPGRMPRDLLALQAYDLVILRNVGAFEVDPRTQGLLATYVHDFGGGLVMVGGGKSFGAGGWNGTPVEAVLPVELDLPKEIRVPRAAVVLVMDRSGSMSQPVAGARATQQEVANRGAALAIRSLRPENLIGVVTFNSQADVRVPLQENTDPEALVERVMTIAPGGGTNMLPALDAALEMLAGVEAEQKRVVCVSDGRSSSPEALLQRAEAMSVMGIRVSTIAVGDGAAADLLRDIADAGEGEFYHVVDPTVLPRALFDSVQVVNRPLIREVTFTPRVRPTGTTLTAGMESAPPLEGLVITAPRPDPRAVVDLLGPENEPLLARWQAGLGRTAAFTSDAGAVWAQGWLPWPGYAEFWTQLVRETARPVVDHDYDLRTRVEAGRLEIALDATDESGEFLDYLAVPGRVYPPDGNPIPVRLRQTGPGRYEASVPAEASGNYIVALTPRDGSTQLPPVIGGVSQPAGAEYRRYRSNLSLLEEIASITGGRLLDVRRPDRAAIYDRAGLPESVSLIPAWRTFLWWAIALFLADVASRRIAWSGEGVRRAWRENARRVGSRAARAEAAKATLSTLRAKGRPAGARSGPAEAARTAPEPPPRREVPFRRPPARPERSPAASSGSAAASDGPAEPSQPARPDPERVRSILSSMKGSLGGGGDGGAGKEAEPAPRSVRRKERGETADERRAEADAPPAEDTRGNLLAAKRRARERLGGRGGGESEGGSSRKPGS